MPSDAERDNASHFQRQVAPTLARHCLECHGATTAEGGLDLSTAQAALAGGEGGVAIAPGDPDASLLWEHVASDEMPKGRPPLSADEKAALKSWIENGAAWTVDVIDPFDFSSDSRAGYDWWSLRPVAKPQTPAVKQNSWPQNDVDHFILASLESAGLRPAEPADRRTLVRRLYFDLVGLPPNPAAVDAFVADESPDAYDRLVTDLLDSPHYGERWARHWLDVVRFGESQGFERNRIRENAWRYRDWVISSLNRDLPYDEFVRRQIAGDVLYPDDLDALLATGYHVCGTWDQVAHLEGSATMKVAARQEHLEDLVATLGQAFMGLTVNCARCHDHKFDPIPQADYYQIAATIGGVTQRQDERGDLVASPDPAPTANAPEQAGFSGRAHVIIPSQPPVFHVLARGAVSSPLRPVAPRGLSAVARSAELTDDFGLAPDAPEAERRKRLAIWLTDPKHPLTARVFVNRVWHYHFGTGIVDTPSDFGYAGGRPSHPELLDYLAARFVREGWSIKRLHRLLVTSATYRQASTVVNEDAESVDAENRLLWRFPTRQLEGEAVRDAALAVSGALERRLGGPSYRDVEVKLKQNHEFTDPTNEFSPQTCRRTIYRLWARSGNHPLLQSLDCPDPSVMMPSRPGTITPVQALSLMNNAFMENCAQRFSDRVRSESAGDSVAHQVRHAYRLALAREPTDPESTLAESFIADHGLAQFCLVLLNTNEFLFVN
jgi:hypothetical protein